MYALLTDGRTVEIRPAGPQDTAEVREMHAAMSPDNMYLRFFSLSPRAGEQEAQRVCRDPGPDHAALLAWLGGRLVGVASYEATGRPGEAEVAFAVPDDVHRCGIATCCSSIWPRWRDSAGANGSLPAPPALIMQTTGVRRA
jgi:hypothetical protein